MASVVHSILEPDRNAIATHLEELFGRCVEEYPDGLIELRHGEPEKLTGFQLFFCTQHGIDMATEHAIRRNMQGENVYVGVNPRKPGTVRQATAADVEISFFHFADIDKAEAVDQLVERYRVFPPSITVTTGTQPNRRPHLYWRLEEPVRNLDDWTERQRGIAQALGGDMVIDPPRIMRLAGTINFPTQKKMGLGYRVERTGIRNQFSDERIDATPELIRQAYPPRQIPALPQAVTEVQPTAGTTTLAAMASGKVRTADLLHACRQGDNWHNNMIRLVAHLAAIGRSDAEILGLAAGITLPGYAVDQTQREMFTALRGARVKFALPEPEEVDVAAEEAEREDGDSVFTLLDLDELESLPPPTWLIDEMIADHGLSIIYGDPGAGKSFIALDMALRIAFGMDWHGTPTKGAGVLYIAGEGARGLGKRVKGWRREHAMEGVEAPFLLLPVAVQLLEPKDRAKLLRTIDAAVARAGFPIGLVIVDTVSRALAGQDENGQESMSMFVAACGEIQVHTGGAVIGVHHSGKDKERGMRGSTVLLGGCDASIKVTKNGEIAMLKTEKQKDAEEASPISFTLKKIEWAAGFDKPESTLVPFKTETAPQPEMRGLSRAQCRRVLDEIDSAWLKGKPWSMSPQTRSAGRYLPAWLYSEFGMSEDTAKTLMGEWQMREILEEGIADNHAKRKGLSVLNRPEDW